MHELKMKRVKGSAAYQGLSGIEHQPRRDMPRRWFGVRWWKQELLMRWVASCVVVVGEGNLNLNLGYLFKFVP